MIKASPFNVLVGLFNQINNFINSLILAHMTERILYTPSMCTDLYSQTCIPWSDIIDMDRLLAYLEMKGIYVSISNEDRYWDTSLKECNFYDTHHTISSLAETISAINTNLDIGCKMLLVMTDITELHRDILMNMILLDKYQQVVDFCKNDIGDNYASIHLRLEDDWISAISASMKTWTNEYTCMSLWTSYILAMVRI